MCFRCCSTWLAVILTFFISSSLFQFHSTWVCFKWQWECSCGNLTHSQLAQMRIERDRKAEAKRRESDKNKNLQKMLTFKLILAAQQSWKSFFFEKRSTLSQNTLELYEFKENTTDSKWIDIILAYAGFVPFSIVYIHTECLCVKNIIFDVSLWYIEKERNEIKQLKQKRTNELSSNNMRSLL